ncbi:MAG: S9 family peptidase [Emcibacter sp.]|nr:S9 family peptidase [Emcibacter sp.]
MKFNLLLVTSLSLILFGCNDSNIEKSTSLDVVTAPVAKKIAYDMEIHGDIRTDNYYWMRDDTRTSPEVLAHLDAENAYSKSIMAHTEKLQDTLFEELKGRVKKDDSSVPYKKAGYWYQSTFSGDQEYPIFIRRKGDLTPPEEIILNTNELAQGKEFFSIGGMSVSTNNNILAYSTDFLSRRLYTIEFKDLTTGKNYLDKLENAEADMVWANDNKTVFYIKKDIQTLLGYQVYRHKLGSDQKDDVLVYEEKDNTFYTALGKTRDDSVIYIVHRHTNKTGASIIDANLPDSRFKPFNPIEENQMYEFSKLGDSYYVRTNWNAKNYRIMKVSEGNTTDKSKWVDVVPHREDVFITDFEVFNNYLVVREKKHGDTQLRVIEIKTGKDRFLKFDDPAYYASIGYNPEINTSTIRINYSSLTTPDSVYEYNLSDGSRTLLKQDEILGGFDPANYASERIFIKARDGKEIPVSLVYRKDKFKKDGTNPLYQYAYGSYGDTTEASFEDSRLSILDRGFVYALAHIRGSQMLGPQWYEDGKLYHKKNTFTDFIDVTTGLTAQGYGDKDKVFAVGLSAGGLLMGAVLNMAPELYKAVAAQVPFVDVVTTMLDSSIPLTTNEYDEWGNPNEKGYYDYMKSYSPYDNVEHKDYPNIMVTTGLNDSQVQYFEPAKWVAKLREYKTDDNLLIFDISMDSGHGGASGRYKHFKDKALELAFFFDLIGITE